MNNLVTTDQAFNLLGLINIIKWPIVILLIFLILSKTISNLINRITKFGIGNKSFEASQQTINQKTDMQESSLIDRAIYLFQPETIQLFKDAVAQETEIEKLRTDVEKIDRLTNYSCFIYLMRHFDIIYNAIFGSQIRILEKLNTLRPATRDSLKFYYELAKNSKIEFFENYSYDQYLDFLFSYSLIREDDDKISLTILGSDFLKYLTETNKDINKLN